MVLVAALVWPPVVHQLRSLTSALPGMGDQAGETIARLQRLSDRAGLGIDIASQIRKTLTAIADRIPQFTGNVVVVGVTVVRQVTYFIIVVVLSIYMLLDGRRIGALIARHFPTRSEADGREYAGRARRAVVDYVKAQVLLSTVMGASVGVAMWILSLVGAFPSGGRYALFFGVWAGLMEAIPYLGPVLAAVPPSVVAVFDSPLSALWVIITFILIQEVEGHILVPVIMGSRFRVHPLVVIFAILAGGEIHGITGMLIAIPLIPLIKETWLFFRPRLQFEGWCAAVTGECPGGPAAPRLAARGARGRADGYRSAGLTLSAGALARPHPPGTAPDGSSWSSPTDRRTVAERAKRTRGTHVPKPGGRAA